jgi:hypothetical protein
MSDSVQNEAPRCNEPEPPTRCDVPGFLRGTRIMTERGEVVVEALGVGMRVLTVTGEYQPIRWIGRRRIDPRRHPRPDWVYPIRIRRGAMGNALPRREMHVSPALMLVFGTLCVAVQDLVNGATIAPNDGLETLEYFHLELDRPEGLLAEGLAAESYRDVGNRAVFGNGGRVLVLHPLPPPAAAPSGTGAGVGAYDLRRRLLQRAHALGFSITREAGLSLRADEWPIMPSLVDGPVHRFSLPAATADLRIVSRAAVPAEIDPTAQDRRRLGVLLERLVLTGPNGHLEIGAGDRLLSEGFHPPEIVGKRLVRWTDGHARLPAEAIAGMNRIELHVVGAQPSWAGAAPPAAPATRSA